MTTKHAKRSKSGKIDAMIFMEKISGGPLTIAGIIKSLRKCDEISPINCSINDRASWLS